MNAHANTDNTAYMSKAHGDYLDTKSGKIRSGSFWAIEVGGLTLRFAGSRSAASIVEHLQNNFGMDLIIYQQLA